MQPREAIRVAHKIIFTFTLIWRECAVCHLETRVHVSAVNRPREVLETNLQYRGVLFRSSSRFFPLTVVPCTYRLSDVAALHGKLSRNLSLR